MTSQAVTGGANPNVFVIAWRDGKTKGYRVEYAPLRVVDASRYPNVIGLTTAVKTALGANSPDVKDYPGIESLWGEFQQLDDATDRTTVVNTLNTELQSRLAAA